MTIICYGSQGGDVRRLQEQLNKSLPTAPPLRLDGCFGPRTEAAVRLFQATVGLSIDGIPGPQTLAALERHPPGQPARRPSPLINVEGAPWMAIATQEIGQTEIDGSRHNPRILKYHATTTYRASTDEAAWCSSFVNWCLCQAGITGTNSAAAISWIHWGKASVAKAGAITVIFNFHAVGSRLTSSGYHVGFLMQDLGSHLWLLGGNQSGRVKPSQFSRKYSRVVAFRWPS